MRRPATGGGGVDVQETVRPAETAADRRLASLQQFAYWLDDGLRVPGTRVRVGLDPILGLVPGLGDAAGAVIAAWMLVEGARLGVSPATLARMALNIGFDAVIGSVPVFGDVFDFFWKSNRKNL